MEQSAATTARRCSTTDDIAIWSTLTPAERAKGLRWFASRSEAEQAQILTFSQTVTLPRLQRANPNKLNDAYMRFAALFLAIRRSGYDLVRKHGYRAAGHEQFEQFEQLRNSTIESLKNRKKAPLRKQIMAYWGEVRTLKSQKKGFYLISRYLFRAHKVKASPQYIAKIWKEVEGE